MTELLVSRSPQQTDDVLHECAATPGDHVAPLIQRSRVAQDEWQRLGAPGRSVALLQAAAMLQQRSREFEDLIVREVGKPRLEARGEVARAVAILNYYSQVALLATGEVLPPSGRGLLYTERRPHGVVGLITPWNFPIAIPLWKSAPALAAGNAVLLKPATAALATALLIGEVLNGVLPGDTFQVIPGEAETATALIDGVDAVSFTGSTGVGRQVAARATMRNIPVQAEMGGQNAAVVMPDAPVGATAAMIASAVAGFAGQKCTATSRVIVVGDPTGMVEALVDALGGLVLGDPSDEKTVIGPVIDENAARTVRSAAESVLGDGGHFQSVGEPPSDTTYVAPVVVLGVGPHHPVNQEETFGPIVSIMPAQTAREAVELANGVRQGLVTSVHGSDLGQLLEVVGQLESGLIRVNAPSTGVDFYAPFGGEKESSTGPREQGRTAVDFYSTSRTVTIAPMN